MAEVRQRAKATDVTIAPKIPTSITEKHHQREKLKHGGSGNGFSVTDILRILGGILLLNSTISYFVTGNSVAWNWRPWYSKPSVVAHWLVSSLCSSLLVPMYCRVGG
jgi:hypothetical protein